METNHENKTMQFSTLEPFGGLLIDRLQTHPKIEVEQRIREYIGQVISRSYVDCEIEAINDDPSYNKPIYDEEMTLDIDTKILQHAILTGVVIKFSKEHFDGLESIAKRAINSIEDLEAERDIVAELASMGCAYVDGEEILTEDDVVWINQDIKKAESAKEVLEALDELRNNQ